MTLSNRHILVTGAQGFIGRNLVTRLRELHNITVSTFVRGDDVAFLPQRVSQVDAIVHLAAENRPTDNAAFKRVNIDFTREVCKAIVSEYQATGRHLPLLLASSSQVGNDSPYGQSKLAAEELVQSLALETNNPCVIYRLPGVFGKWCKPDYNSVVATFCNNVAHGLPIEIHDPTTKLHLVYVDDVVEAMLGALETPQSGCVQGTVHPEYVVTLGELADQIRWFDDSRSALFTERVGTGFLRALYATYVSYLPKQKFSYLVPQYADSRGVFVEFLKTPDSGQFSYFTLLPGHTRGGHYHHTKTEKFLIAKGEALFRFRNLLTNELVELRTNGEAPQIVDTIPGWTHDVTNIGNVAVIAMLWANENFSKEKPDTVTSSI